MKKIISILLGLILILEAAPCFAFAETADKNECSKIPYYVSIGDSIAGGYALRSHKLEDLGNDMKFLDYVLHNSAETCYPRLVANEIAKLYGKKKADNYDFANVGATAFSISDYVKLFSWDDDTNAQDIKDFIIPYYQNDRSQLIFAAIGKTNPEDLKWGVQIKEEVKKADIISINYGSNDIMQPLWEDMMEGHSDNPIITLIGVLFKVLSLDVNILELDLPEILSSEEIKGFLGENSIESMLKKVNLKTLIEAIEYFNPDHIHAMLIDNANKIEESYKEATELIKKYNPNAKYVFVGGINPYGKDLKYKGTNYTIPEILSNVVKELLDLCPLIDKDDLTGTLASVLYKTLGSSAQDSINILNKIARETAESYKDPFIYITDKLENTGRIGVHPNAAQHAQIANAICDVLIPQISYASNKEGYTFKNTVSKYPDTAVYGSTIKLTVPNGVDYICVNDKKIWDTTVKTRTPSFEVKDQNTVVYFHYGNMIKDIAEKLTFKLPFVLNFGVGPVIKDFSEYVKELIGFNQDSINIDFKEIDLSMLKNLKDKEIIKNEFSKYIAEYKKDATRFFIVAAQKLEPKFNVVVKGLRTNTAALLGSPTVISEYKQAISEINSYLKSLSKAYGFSFIK